MIDHVATQESKVPHTLPCSSSFLFLNHMLLWACVILLNSTFYDTKWELLSSLTPVRSDTSNLVHFWHELPGVNIRFHRFKGLILQDYPYFRHQPQIGCPGYPHFCPANYEFRISHDPTFGGGGDFPTNPLERLTELRKALYLLSPFTIKDTTQEHPNGRHV